MARILNNPFGDMRGSVGDNTFSRNASGAIMRKKVKPTNPRSLAQTQARANFREAGKGYASLTADQRAQFQDFALNTYNPLRKKNKKNYTANQAFTALKNSLLNANQLISPTTIIKFGGTTTFPGITFNMASIANTVPLQSVQPNVLDGTGFAASLTLVGAAFDSTKKAIVDLQFQGLQGAGLAQGNLVDINSKAYGIQIYISDAVNGLGLRPKTIFKTNLGFTGFPTFTTQTLATLRGIRVSIDGSAAVARMKTSPVTGQIFLMTVALTSFDGTQTKLGDVYVKFGIAAAAVPA